MTTDITKELPNRRPINVLSAEETEVVRRAIAAMPEILDEEFSTRMGITEEKAGSLLKAWPDVDDTEDDSHACVAINNSLNDILYGEGLSDEQCLRLTGADRRELNRIYQKYAAARGWKSTGIR